MVSQAKWSRTDRSNVQRTGSNWSPLATGQIMQPLSGCMSPQPLISNIVPSRIDTNRSRFSIAVVETIEFPLPPIFRMSSPPKTPILSMDLEEERGRKDWETNGGDGDDWQIQFFDSIEARKIGRRRIFARGELVVVDSLGYFKRKPRGKPSFIELRTFNIEPAAFIFGRHALGNRRKIHSASGSWFLVSPKK